MSKKLTQEEFLNRVKENNTNDIDLSEFIYVNNNTKGKCTCNVCGHVWYPVPMSLFNGHGCPQCAIKYRAKKLASTTEEFIEDSMAVHGDEYIYDLVDYVNDATDVYIICRVHGIFPQKPGLHKSGHGCPYCHGGIAFTKEKFLSDLKIKNSHNLILDDFEYVNMYTKIKCKCGDCGYEWETTPIVLIGGSGCPICATKERGLKRRKPFDEFVAEYNEKFPNNNFIFIEDTYKTALTDMTVICPIHGKFEKTPNELLNGANCPYCNESKLEREIRGFFENKNVNYIQHKNDLEWLKYINLMSLDFYLPEYNIAIECQGSQHYKETNYYGGKEKLEKQQKRDKKKFDLCNEHDIKLLYYTDYKGEIPEIYQPFTYYDKDKLLEEIRK